MEFLCLTGAIGLSGAVIYHQWKLRNHHITVTELIEALTPVDPLNPCRRTIVQNCKAIIAWCKRPAETISSADREHLEELNKLAQVAKRKALSEQLNMGYIVETIGAYKAMKDCATALVSEVAPEWTIALNHAL
jgi:hypothetical protein